MPSWLSSLLEIFKGSDGQMDWPRIGVVIAALAGGGWTVYTFFADREKADEKKGGDTTFEGPVTYGPSREQIAQIQKPLADELAAQRAQNENLTKMLLARNPAAGPGAEQAVGQAVQFIRQGAEEGDPGLKQALGLLDESKLGEALPLLETFAKDKELAAIHSSIEKALDLQSASKIPTDVGIVNAFVEEAGIKQAAAAYKNFGAIAGLSDPKRAEEANDKAQALYLDAQRPPPDERRVKSIQDIGIYCFRTLKRSNSEPGSWIEEQTDNRLRESLNNVLPSAKEEENGFKTYPRLMHRNHPDVPVVLSEIFNHSCLANREWDIKLNRLSRQETTNPIITRLKSKSDVLVDYLTVKFSRAFHSINPLTNDRKIGFRSPIIQGAQSIDIFETDYFTGLCTEGLTTTNLFKTVEGRREVMFKASDYCHLETHNGEAIRLLDFDDTSKPCSLQGAVDVIAISRDHILRLALQSGHAQYSRGTRAPLASGSMDWEDQEKCKTLKQLIIKAAYRELIEEWGKKHPTLPRLRVKEDKIRPIGFFRMPHRGGKPEFVVFAKLENYDQDLNPDPAEVERGEESEHARTWFSVPDLPSLRGATTQMLEGGGTYRDSVPLYGTLLCLEHAIAHPPEVICQVAGYSSK